MTAPSNQTMIDELETIAESGRLSTWETDFLATMTTVCGVVALSDAQEEKLGEIHTRYCR